MITQDKEAEAFYDRLFDLVAVVEQLIAAEGAVSIERVRQEFLTQAIGIDKDNVEGESIRVLNYMLRDGNIELTTEMCFDWAEEEP